MDMLGNPLPLQVCHVPKFSLIINRTYTLIHSIAIAFLIYYRVSFFSKETRNRTIPTLPCLLLFASELLLSFAWILKQVYRWRPVYRTVFPERLPSDDKLPAIDVFICTADPNKEPTVEVMNTVISAMALDYPPEKLHVYLSDDGGSDSTLRGTKEAWNFARSWVPFCRRYDIKTSCPEAYFSGYEEYDHGNFNNSSEFEAERQKIKEKYEKFKQRVRRALEEHRKRWETDAATSSRDHPSTIEIIQDYSNEEEIEEDDDEVKMPLLVYVAREKRPSHHHHFKAGALNVLLRVSAMMSDSPYFLVLDCDMYCNDPTSARQAMCCLLDPSMSPSLAFVQFPQTFRNLGKNDIYDSQFRSVFKIQWQGLDGLGGPGVSGTNFYMKREALLGNFKQEGVDLVALKRSFGSSNEFIKTLRPNFKPSFVSEGKSSSIVLEEVKVLASSSYEDQTTWGTEVGFLHFCVMEDLFTSFHLHCKGWKSAYLNPQRPQFLGTCTTNLADVLIHCTRAASGLTQVAISRFCPLFYEPSSSLSLLQRMAYVDFTFWPLLYSLSLWGFALIPQFCLLNGVPLYPEVSDPYFGIFLFIFTSSLAKSLYEILMTGGEIQTWINEWRIWMIESVTSLFYGSLDAILNKLGLSEASFLLTNKAQDDEQVKRYEKGIFDFQAPTTLLAPLVTIILVNIASFVGGVIRMIGSEDWRKMVGQISLTVYILMANYAVIEGIVIRKDKARIRSSVTLLSAAFSVIILTVGSVVLC